MKHHFLLLTIIFAVGILNAQETYRFRTDAPQGLNIESSTTSGISLHYVLNEITVADVEYGESRGQEIVMKGSFGSFAEGLPNLPYENRYIAVPRGAKVSVKVTENGYKSLNGIDLLPAAKVILNRDDKSHELHKDMNVYGKDANFPAENVTIAQTTQIRGLDVVLLSVTPFRYNPVRKTLEVIYDMDIEVYFEGGDGQFGDPRYRNPEWDNILRDLVINSDMLPDAHYHERLNEAIRNGEEACEYLIVIPDETAFQAWADTLKQFRTKQGILTKVVTTTDCGGKEPEDIRNYILNAYNNWTIPPAAVLLFGENHKSAPEFGIKPFLFTSPPSNYQVYQYASDNPFADMNGDSIPDLAISRLVTKYPSECQRQVEKLIDYELNPPTESHFYDHPVITSGYQKEKWFFITSQCVNSFFCNKLGKHPTNLYMMYTWGGLDPTPPTSIWSTATNTQAVLDYYGPNGTQYLPSSIGTFDQWIDMNDRQQLIDALNEGGFFTFYRDHSGESLWCCPWFEGENISFLQNKKPTFIFSIGCSTNNYWDNWTTCLSERFVSEKVGAIGVIGANTVTYSHFNDLISWGAFDYIWPDYMPTLGSHTESDKVLPSYALVAGKLFLREQAFLPYDESDSLRIKIEKTLNLFSFLGETYLNLHTAVPQPLSIDAPLYYADEQRQYTFKAEAGTTLCLSNENGIVAVARATGELQSIAMPPCAIGERLTLTATHQNRFRHTQTVTVISAEQPFVYLKSAILNDQDGNGQVDYGEYADIDIVLQNIGLPALETGEITLFSDSPYVEILQGTTQYPLLDTDSTCTINNAFRIRLTNDVPDQKKVIINAHVVESGNSHDDPIQVIANAPLITISPEFHPQTSDGGPSTHISTEGKSFVTFNVKNAGHAPVDILNSTLEVKAPFVETTPSLQDGLNPEEEAMVTIELNTTPNDITGAWLQSRLDVQYGEYHAYFDTIMQYGGIIENFETDTLNTFFAWTNSGLKWEYCTEDAYEGRRCFISTSDAVTYSSLKARLRKPHVGHNCKLSFYYTTGNNPLQFFTTNQNYAVTFSDNGWHYAEVVYNGNDYQFNWRYNLPSITSSQAKLDNICFPPLHTTIAYAGNELVACESSAVELSSAYAYDCDSVYWVTDGDGHFEDETIVNTNYWPGSQDIANGEVTLTLIAISTSETLNSTTQIRFVDNIELGAIVGDSVVNKYENPVSHYSIENQPGVNYVWHLEPAKAGVICSHGNTIDLIWNLHEGDAEVSLSVMADNGCEVEPVAKTISLIGAGATEWHALDFDLYPNPTDGKVNLVIGETLQGKAVIEVYNLLGERIMAKKVGKLRKGETANIDLNSLVSGLYIIKLCTENGSCTKKVNVW